MSEFDLIGMIARATRQPRRDVALGIGDDAALLRVPAGRELVVAMDTLVDGVHFPHRTSAESVGWKALAVNLSDLAAMGAEPAWATLALTLPAPDREWVRGFARGFAELARSHGVALVGGDTTRGPLTITVQAHGLVPPRTALTRSGARSGDDIYVSGTLGDAAAALALSPRTRSPAALALRERLDRPSPRIALGLALRRIARAAIDVSDGLLADLGHVLDASRVGAALELAALPASAALRQAVRDAPARQRLQMAGGDDYELCFTAAPAQRGAIARLALRLSLPLSRIGSVTRRRGLRVCDAQGDEVPVRARGWDHFRA